tara:strand:- start:464 stop:709 length:246 start_codon:yes stop_codon:yes gene_type:complete
MKTKAQELGITEFPYKERDNNGYITYYEDSVGYWYKSVYGDKGNKIYYEHSNGIWYKNKFDNEHNLTYFENYRGKKMYYIT